MPKVNLKEIEEAEKKKSEAEAPMIKKKRIGDKVYYSGTHPDDWYDTPGEALNAHQNEQLKTKYKKLGLDEFGRTKEQAEQAEKIKSIIEKRTKLMDQIRDLDGEIGLVRSGLPLGNKDQKKDVKKK